MDQREINRKIDEFCEVGNLEEFREIITDIFNEIAKEGCRISTRTDFGPACHNFQKEDCYIKIPILKYVANPIDAIWVILHEFGHHLSGDIPITELHKDDVKLNREIEAWNIARIYVNRFPLLKDRIAEFNLYAENCIDSYRRMLVTHK